VSQKRPALFRGRHLQDVIIILCVRWYLRSHCYAPILNQRLGRERRHPNRSWRVDETYIRRSGKLGVSVSRRRFYRRHDRFHVVAQPEPNGCQALLEV